LRSMLIRAVESLLRIWSTETRVLRYLRLRKLRWLILRICCDRWSGDMIARSAILRRTG